jgi:hypothetical protein
LDVVIQKAHEPPTQECFEVAMSPPTQVPNVHKDAKGKSRWKIIKDDDGKDVVWTNERPKLRSQQTKSLKGRGESTLSPSKIVVTSIIFVQIFFLVIYGHHILDFLICLKYIFD